MSEARSIWSGVEHLKQVGEKRKQALNDLGIESIYDLLQHYPYRYNDLSVDDLHLIEDKQKVVLRGEVLTPATLSYFGRKKSRLTFRLLVKGIPIPVTFFNQPYLKDKIIQDDTVMVYGQFDGWKKSLVAQRLLAVGGQELKDSLEPIYPANLKITGATIKKLIQQAYRAYHDQIPQSLPQEIREKYQLMAHAEAIGHIHFPKTKEDQAEARREIKMDELFAYHLKLQSKRLAEFHSHPSYCIDYKVQSILDLVDHLPFDLTEAQKRSINQICADFKQPYPMYRMLQGDVGSGKTLVAAAGMLATQSAGGQSALMVPTEILADQHYQSLHQLLEGLGVRLALLSGSTPAKDKRLILETLASGEIDVLIGTHALIEEPVQFQHLQFIVIDEQHRFGVKQRQALEDKATYANVLYMTATPIPRSMALTSYGDMDMSILDEKPKGRKAIQTRWITQSTDPKIDYIVSRALETGNQVYIINALIDGESESDLLSTIDSFEHYRRIFGSDYGVGMLHGQMSAEEKEAVMQDFKENRLQILISTTVIEVGVDVPNANLMVIYDADRFGLAQLHQLRGRIGRGQQEALCVLVGQPKTEEGKKRLALMTESQDGFYLSEKDLEIRGPGDVFGERQSGIPQFKMVNLVEDYPLMEIAKKEALHYIHQHPEQFKGEKNNHENSH